MLNCASVLRTYEVVMAAKKSRFRAVVKIFSLAAIFAVFMLTFSRFANYSLDLIWSIRFLLVFAAVVVIAYSGKKVPTPSPIELYFFSDYLMFHRPKRRYNKWVTRKEYSKMKYSDISRCVYIVESNTLQLYGKQYVVCYNVLSNGMPAPTPLHAGFVSGSSYRFAVSPKNGLKFKNAIEACAPIQFAVEYWQPCW